MTPGFADAQTPEMPYHCHHAAQRTPKMMATKSFLPALVAASLLTVPVVFPQAARAEVAADQAKSIETQLRDWMVSLVKPSLDVGDRPIQVAPEGDHFRMLMPAPAMLGALGLVDPGLQLSMTARPMDGGRWALEDLRFPSPLRFKLPAGAEPNAKPTEIEISTESQEFHGVLDPSFATTSSFDGALTNLRTKTSGSNHIAAKVTGHSIWQPAGDGRINLLGESGSDKISATNTLPDGGSVAYSIEKSRSSSTLKNFAPASLATLLRSVSALIPTLQDQQDQLTPPQRVLARDIVFSLRDMLGGIETSQSVEGLKVNAAGHTASLAKFTAGGTVGAAEGKLTWSTQFAAEGFDSTEVPPGVFREYLPRRLTFKPSISGVPADGLVKLALRAIDSTAKDMPALQADAMALMSVGPLEVAIDDLILDLGRATLLASGSMDINSPTDISGDAEITVTGLTTLIKRANTAPELKDIAPALIFLKGIGKQNGDETVWAISYDNGNFTINDTDLSALLPGGAPPTGGAKKKK